MKYQSERHKKQNNKGFTMVELLLSIMILSIVSSAIFSFMIMGGRLFNRSNEEVDMQSEAQLLKNYMNNMLTDVTKHVDFITENTPYGADACLIAYGENYVSYMAWFGEDAGDNKNQVHFLKKEGVNVTPNQEGKYQHTLSGSDAEAANWPILAEGVSQFECDATDLKAKNRIFTAKLGFKTGRSSYETSHAITLRNDIFYEASENGNLGAAGGVFSKVNGITLVPGMVDGSKGSTIQYTHTVQGVGHFNSDVNYSIEGNTSADTKMEGNVLHIGTDENASIITVICQSASDAKVAASSVVNVSNISGIRLIPNIAPNYKEKFYYTDTEIIFEAFVDGDYITAGGKEVTWTLIDSGNSARILESTDTTCKINTGTIMDQTITLKAASKADSSVTREYVIRTADIQKGELYIAAVGGEYKVKRGAGLQLQVLENGTQITQDITWSLLENPLDKELTIDSNGMVNATTNITYGKGYSATVQAEVQKTGIKETITCVIKIDPVRINFDPAYVIVVGNSNASRVTVSVEGLNIEDEELSIQQKPYVGGLNYWTTKGTDDTFILGLNMTKEEPITEYSVLKVSLKGHSSVSSELKTYYYKYNMIHDNNRVYVPIPGDRLNLVTNTDNTDNELIPETAKEIKLNGVTYGYTNVTVNGVVYHYYVDRRANANPKWFIRVGSSLKQYRYVKEEGVFEEYTP